jgi:hypothetical protein
MITLRSRTLLRGILTPVLHRAQAELRMPICACACAQTGTDALRFCTLEGALPRSAPSVQRIGHPAWALEYCVFYDCQHCASPPTHG